MKFVALTLALGIASALAGAPPTPESAFNDAGYIDVHDGEHHLFYWYFESRDDPANDPVILWMSGGPGCSSSLALFGENGPLVVNDDLSLDVNEQSWNANATVIWVDQPVGTGFSYGGKLHSEDQVEDDMYEFLQGWFAKYPQYAANDFHIFGESYAGHYVPVVAQTVMQRGGFNLKGAAIGNGLTDPAEQYKWYLPYAQDASNPLEVSDGTEALMAGALKICEPMITGCNYNGSRPNLDDSTGEVIDWVLCLNAYTLCNIGLITPVQMSGVNPYDVRRQCGSDPLCYDFSAIDGYLNQDDVKEALGVTGEWAECSHLVDLIMVYGGDWMKEFQDRVTDLLDGGVDVLVYAGEYDFICNWLGNKAWTQTLPWSGATEYANAVNTTWTTASGDVAGSFLSGGGMTFLKVFDAGHMVPRDQPENALDMVLKHINGFFNTKNDE